jgi:putative ABC transport system permease protein
MLQDLRYALRSLMRVPAFTVTSILTLALAAGANAAILAVVYAILLKPLPYDDPDRLVAVWPGRFQSNVDLLYLREHSPMFSSLAAVAPGWSMSLTGAGEPVKLTVARVSGNLFQTLGTPPLLGRAFDDRHARPGADAVIVLSHSLWRNQFGGDVSVIGRSVQIDGSPFEVMAVMPRGFEVFGLRADAYTPFAIDPSAWHYQVAISFYVARLAAGRTIDQADRDYKALIPQIRKYRGYPDDYGRTAHLKGLRDAVVGDVSSSLVALASAVVLILLVAGANVGILQLTRASARGRDIAVRSALGASALRLARQLIAEGVLLGAASAAVGIALAKLMLPILVTLLPSDTPRMQEVTLSGPAGIAILAAALVIALLVGIAPLFAVRRLSIVPLLRSATTSESRAGKRTRGVLVTAEIGAAVVLTIGAGLMIQSVMHLQRIDPGFRGVESVLTLHVQPSTSRFRNAAVSDYYDGVLERVKQVPGVTAAGAIQHLPFSGYSWSGSLDVEGHVVAAGAARPVAGLRIATPGYFEALGQPIVAGRGLERADATRNNTVVVNAALAAKYFGSPAGAIGRTLRINGAGIQGAWLSVVGVVADVRHTALTAAPVPEIYTSVSKNTIPAMMLAIRASGDTTAIIPPVREAIWAVERDVPISDVRTMDQRIAQSLGRPRLLTTLLGMFGALGALIAAVGVYGVVAYSVSRRRHELGIMMALGADRARVMRSVLREGALYAVGGLVIGLPAAFAGSRLLRTLVYGVRPTDPATYLVIGSVVAVLVVAACAVPAYRASRIDPVVVLKD